MAWKHYQAGRLQQAEELYQQILQADPNQVDALHLLGLIAAQSARYNLAADYLKATVRLKPDFAAAHNNLGNVFVLQSKLTEAVESFRQAVRHKPDFAAAHSNLGNALRDLGHLEEALVSLREAVRLRPDFAEAHNNLGISLLRKGKLEEAEASCRQALCLKPGYAEAHNNLGLVLQGQGKLSAAAASYQQALHYKPDFADAHLNQGVVLGNQGKLEAAHASLEQAIRLQPDNAHAYHALGNVYKEQGRLDDAIAAHRTALRLKPDEVRFHSSLLLLLNLHPGFDARMIYEESRCWNQQHAEPLQELIQAHPNQIDPDRRLRIGYVSPDFREHSSSSFTLPLLSRHDHRQFEIFCYADVTRPGAVTERLRGYADHWRSTVGLSDQQVADLVRTDQIDILVDLAMHTANNRLLVFARRPAPVQVAWLAYPGTTGLSTMDYRLTDPHLDPPGLFDPFYSEESIRLPESFWCYDPLTDQALLVNPLPALEKGIITYGCLNDFGKLNPGVLLLWAKVLQTVPRSRLLMLAPRGQAREQLLAGFGHEGIASSRVHFADKQPRLEYFKFYHQIDVALDPFPCNGGTTTLDAFWMGVPTITLLGKTVVGRAGWSLLCNLGLQELAAETPEQYVALAARLADNLPKLQELRRTLRQRMQQSPLMDGNRFARHVEQAYRQMWRKWCEQPRPAEIGKANMGDQPPLEEGNKQDDAQASFNHGRALAQQLKYDEAAAAYQHALRLKPESAGAYNNLGNVFILQGKLPEAVDSLRQAVRCKPDFAGAHSNLGNALRELGHLEEAVVSLREALRLRPDYAEAHSSLILTLHYHPHYGAEAIHEECRRWNQQFAEPLKSFILLRGNLPDPERKLRIGYVSPDFRDHVISFAIVPLLSSHDHEQFEIFCYADVARPDAVTERLRRYADVWRSTAGLSDQQVADLVRTDQIDILVDLAMHTANNRLLVFARKPAPVQVAWAAYPGTTGLPAIDYRLTDPHLDPPGLFDSLYAEESVRLPDSFWCYDPLTDQPPVNGLPALENGVITFGCLNTFCKVNDACLTLWARVLQAVPRSRLVLMAPRGKAREHLLARLANDGIPASRVEFADKQARREYLKLYQRIDLGLDPTPYNGHTTSLDAFWMGVPTITLVSKKTAFGRAGWSQLCNLGLKELAAETPEQYVALAAQWADDLPRLQELRGTLRQRMQQSPLMDGKRFARNVEQAYRQMWRRWCHGQQPNRK
jgi:predicted O-linked N-acetylglucosamine transferase (SPINDLY family)